MALTLGRSGAVLPLRREPIRNGSLGRGVDRWRAAAAEHAGTAPAALVHPRWRAGRAWCCSSALGLLTAATSPDRERLELEAAGAIALDGNAPDELTIGGPGTIDTTTTTVDARGPGGRGDHHDHRPTRSGHRRPPTPWPSATR